MGATISGLNPNIEKREIDSLSVAGPGTIKSWALELTSRCNLRCTYCSVPHSPAYGATDMSFDQISKILKLLEEGQVGILNLSGRGELTYYEGWTDLVELFLDAGIPLKTVTNVAKPLSWKEAELLARFHSLIFSIDSADREQMKLARKGADLRNILYNINLIKAAAVNLGRDKMPFSVIAVLNKSNALKIRKLAALVVSLGASQLTLQDLVLDYSPDVDSIDVSHISHLSADELKEFAQQYQDAQALCAKHGIVFSTYPTVVELVEMALGGGDSSGHGIAEVSFSSKTVGDHLRHAKPLAEGETRQCLQPWKLSMFMADGGVEPCCGSFGNVGSYMDAESLNDIVNIPEIVQLRDQLLSGDVPNVCNYCNLAPPIKIEDFRKGVEAYLQTR